MSVSFAKEIRPLFREKDIDAMQGFFDLSKHEDVKTNADAILNRLADGTMPCDAPWPEEQVELFKQWIDDGALP